jgi:hypothetical protein
MSDIVSLALWVLLRAAIPVIAKKEGVVGISGLDVLQALRRLPAKGSKQQQRDDN